MDHALLNVAYDYESDTCFGFDPRDAQKRQLEELNCTLQTDCFNCSFTEGLCTWQPEDNEGQNGKCI